MPFKISLDHIRNPQFTQVMHRIYTNPVFTSDADSFHLRRLVKEIDKVQQGFAKRAEEACAEYISKGDDGRDKIKEGCHKKVEEALKSLAKEEVTINLNKLPHRVLDGLKLSALDLDLLEPVLESGDDIKAKLSSFDSQDAPVS